MQGVQAFEPNAKASIDLESFVAEDHFLRRIDRILELSFVRELTARAYVVSVGRRQVSSGHAVADSRRRFRQGHYGILR